MADQKITELNELTSLSDDDLFVVVDNPSGTPATKKITKANALNGFQTSLTFSTGLTDTSGTITTNDSQIVHDNLSGFVSNEHINHTSVSINSGTGLTGGGDISANRTISLSHLGIESLSDPNADRIIFWDDSATTTTWLSLGTGLSITGTTINVSLSSFTTDNLTEGSTNKYDQTVSLASSGSTVTISGTYPNFNLEVDTSYGDVTGPSSSTDNAIVTFDETTGKILQDSGLLISEGKIYQSGYPNSYIKFNNGTIEIWAGGVKQAAWE